MWCSSARRLAIPSVFSRCECLSLSALQIEIYEYTHAENQHVSMASELLRHSTSKFKCHGFFPAVDLLHVHSFVSSVDAMACVCVCIRSFGATPNTETIVFRIQFFLFE